jgi:hypothetical protein
MQMQMMARRMPEQAAPGEVEETEFAAFVQARRRQKQRPLSRVMGFVIWRFITCASEPLRRGGGDHTGNAAA